MLKAVVLGTGFAGEGHTVALRANGIEVAGMVGRTPKRVEEVTRALGIPHGSTDWTKTLETVQPDLVAIATPGGWRREPILEAIRRGCHVFCDKPLEVTAERAKDLRDAAREAGVKTAFAASFCYQPYCREARKQVAAGTIGTPLEVECLSHYNLDPLIPFHWSHRVAQGGGRLSNNFTHKLSIVETILGCRIWSVMGEVRNDMKRAPKGERVHDFRKRDVLALDEDVPEGTEWEKVDSEWSYLAVGRFRLPQRDADPVTALFKHGGLQPRKQPDSIAVYGSDGALFIEGAYAQGPMFFKRKSRASEWKEVPLSAEVKAWTLDVQPAAERNWAALIREFKADIESRAHEPYQTFDDGWRYQVIVDLLRNGEVAGYREVPAR